ncbi:unnamed protein product [Periconia digitata]|uniref:Uncharacterized protein n=1 Tax=Periconia digitata TaxID=1303443 RepID=A0A9W4UIA6_9PLEO|nr:unnamed protein product [Periconia digitata]
MATQRLQKLHHALGVAVTYLFSLAIFAAPFMLMHALLPRSWFIACSTIPFTILGICFCRVFRQEYAKRYEKDLDTYDSSSIDKRSQTIHDIEKVREIRPASVLTMFHNTSKRLFPGLVKTARTVAGMCVWIMVLTMPVIFVKRLLPHSLFVALCIAAVLSFLNWLYWTFARYRYEGHLTADQLTLIVKLRQIVADTAAHTNSRRTQDRARLPEKPSLSDVQEIFQECEVAIGLLDRNVRWAINQLSTAAIAQNDHPLQIYMFGKLILAHEAKEGKDSDAVIWSHAQLGRLHFLGKDYEKATQSLESAMQIQEHYVQNGINSKRILKPEEFLLCRKTLAIAYVVSEQFDAAEILLLELISLEKARSAVPTETLGIEHLSSCLIGVYAKKIEKKAGRPSEEGSENIAIRYMCDALLVASELPSWYAFHLKALGRSFIFMGKSHDADMAFRLANTVQQDGDKIGIPQKRECSTGEDHTHSFRTCDVCSADIYHDDSWFFCKTCRDIDLCVQCYSNFAQYESRDWEGIEKFTKECIDHEFYEVRNDLREDGITIENWISDVCQRLKMEM